jgi:uncharacterized RDD family membrane protein YckC
MPEVQDEVVGWEGKPLASWGTRVGATLIDWLILLVPVVLIVVVVVVVAYSSGTGAAAVGLSSTLAYFVALCLYAPLLMARKGSGNGQTLGKQMLGIRVVRDAGAPYDFGTAFLREVVIKGLLFGVVGGWFLAIPTILDYLWPLWDDENRCLHDFVASSHVVEA